MLIFDRLFRFSILALLGVGVGLALALPKVWRASPQGFSPVVKLSGLDYLQAWSLRRTARKEAARGRVDDALCAWRLAIANNPADPDLLRECIVQLADGRVGTQVPITVAYGRWLLRLTSSNRVDLALIARAFYQLGREDLTLYTLAPFEDQLDSGMETLYLRALFDRGQSARFADRWDQAQGRGLQFKGPELPLYRAAYNAGWTTGNPADEGQRALDLAKADPRLRVLAHRLQLKVSERLLQPAVYLQALQVLEETRQDRLAERIVYWRLLAAVGRKSDALKLSDAYVTPPESGEETVLLARVYFDLGNADTSRVILRRYAPQFSDSEAVWLTYANLLTEQNRWQDLLELAHFLRHENNPIRDPLMAFSFYTEGLAQFGLERRAPAEAAFKRIPGAPVKNDLWELVFAEKIRRLGFPDAAAKILLRIEKTAPKDSDFWVLLARTAFDLKDPNRLVSALASAYRLRPEDPVVLDNYAAALLATRQRPDEALRLTARMLERDPHRPGALINRGLALLQNGRSADAEELLRGLEPAQLSAGDLSAYQFAMFDLHSKQGRYADARRIGAQIDRQYLLPPEIQWLETEQSRMP